MGTVVAGKTVDVSIRFAPEGKSVSGTLTRPGAPELQFDSWLALFSVLRRLAPDTPNPGVKPGGEPLGAEHTTARSANSGYDTGGRLRRDG